MEPKSFQSFQLVDTFVNLVPMVQSDMVVGIFARNSGIDKL